VAQTWICKGAPLEAIRNDNQITLNATVAELRGEQGAITGEGERRPWN
jgi:hypothetical protein